MIHFPCKSLSCPRSICRKGRSTLWFHPLLSQFLHAAWDNNIMNDKWKHYLERWTGAGLIDSATADRIRVYEAQHESEQGMRTPVLIALALGCIAIGAGVLLFVAAHWEQLSPMSRLFLVLAMVGGFHIAGAFSV